MKKITSLLMGLCLILVCLTLLSMDAQAAEVLVSGSCGDNLTWTLDDNGLLTISGSGYMDNWWSNEAPWYSYRASIQSVKLEQGVTTIGAYAFFCNSLTSISIPDSVTSIENNAFRYCSNLTSVIFTGSAPSFRQNAFGNSWDPVRATAYYPCSDASWTEDTRQNYGGDITWKKNHNCPSYTVSKAATCTSDEVISGTCKDCHKNVLFLNPNTTTDHSYQEVITDLTCTKDGYITHKCTLCGDSYKGDSVPAPGHSYGPSNGCTVCGAAGDIIIHLQDSDGNGWNANKLKVYENGRLVTTATISSGSSHQVTVNYYSGKVYTFQWVTGSFSHECSFDIALRTQKRFSATAFDCLNFTNGQTVYTLDSDCKHSYQPSVTYPTLTANGYTTLTCKDCGYSYVESYAFSDVPKTLWSYQAVEFAVAKGYFTGYKSGQFGPGDNITRQDFVVVLARIAGVDLKQYSGRTGFPDVQAGSYYEAAVKWASTTGVVSGYNNGKFGVGDKITREQLVTILYRYAKKIGCDTSVPGTAKNLLSKYTDANKVNSYAKDAVIWALDKGIISGMTATTVGPQNNASRGQVATILMNISKKSIMPI